jgi:hypothetical protein
MTLICVGAPQAVNTNSTPGQITSGITILKAALILQAILMVFLVTVAIGWHWKCSGDTNLILNNEGRTKRDLKRVIYTLYLSCGLIVCCNIFRMVEYFEYSSFITPTSGPFLDASSVSPIVRYEWLFWVFDAAALLCNSLLWNVMHIAKELPKDERVYLADDGTEKQGLIIGDPRSGWGKIFDPFDLRGLAMGYPEKWWEVSTGNSTTDDTPHCNTPHCRR